MKFKTEEKIWFDQLPYFRLFVKTICKEKFKEKEIKNLNNFLKKYTKNKIFSIFCLVDDYNENHKLLSLAITRKDHIQPDATFTQYKGWKNSLNYYQKLSFEDIEKAIIEINDCLQNVGHKNDFKEVFCIEDKIDNKSNKYYVYNIED